MMYPSEEKLSAPVEWVDCTGDYQVILFHKSKDGIAKITINRPQVRNAFRPVTGQEMSRALACLVYPSPSPRD